MHYLNRTSTMLASFEDKILAQLTVSTFSKKRTYSKIIKVADKVKIENRLFINKYTNNKLPSIFTN